MRKLFVLTGILCLFSLFSKAQSITVKGSVTDTASKTSLHNAVIYLKDPRDSSLVVFARAGEKGGFEMPNITPGTYIMVVTYPNYVDWIDSVQVKAGGPLNIAVALTTKAHLLQEVIVRQTIPPIRIKGDTTEYTADSFHVKPGATVEELLRIMPGFSVDSKGAITTQGTKVQKVLVDGDEFFGDDPTMATQNLNAKDIAKVQVFDKKSDQSVLTGIDDGEKQKTINLVMKEDAKKGYFGTVSGGSDMDKYYHAKVMANRFTSTMKMGILGVADRTGRNGMSWEDSQDFSGSGMNIQNGEVTWEGDYDNDFDTWNQEGIPENRQVAAMFNKKFGTRRNSTATNLNYSWLNMAGEGYTSTKYILQDTTNYSNQSRANKSTRWKQEGSTKNEFNIDSLTTLNINARGSFGRSSSYGLQEGEYLAGDLTPINTNKRINTSNGDKHAGRVDLFVNRKLNKTGTRFITVNGGIGNNYSTSEGYLYNATSFYTNGIPSSQQVTDQRKTNTNNNNLVQGLISYTEPLSKVASLNVNYTYNVSNTDQDTRSYEKTGGKYDSLNPIFSNHYKFVSSSHRGGLTFNYKTRKLTGRAGIALQDLSLKQTNLYKDSSFSRDFTNFFPSANLTWKFTSSGSLSFYYNGYTQQPSLSALQPIANNNDPLNIQIGNPALHPSFNHNMSFYLNDYKQLKNRGMGARGGFNFTENAFTSKSVIDAQGKQVTQTVNVNGNYNYYAYLNINRQLKFLKLDLYVNAGISGSRNRNFVNGIENETRTFSPSMSFDIGRYIEKKMDIYISGNARYNSSSSSINTNVTTKYWTFNQSIWFNYRFKKGWNISTDYDFNYRQKLTANDRANNVFIWNASVEKKILKKQDVVAIFTVRDILNQRQGFNRSITSNYITENTYTTIQRYAMLSLRWKFAKNRKTDPDEE